MPAIYAHDRFGAEVAARLDQELQTIVRKYPAPYAIGLQGPDVLFFYRAWGYNRVNQYGVHLHKISALPFFRHALRVVQRQGRDSAPYAYLMGFICHFVLDSECHPYVRQMMQETGVPHLEIEEEFEKKLLRMDGKDPVSYPMAGLVPTDRATAEAIAPFYAKISPEIAGQALKDMKTIKKLFTAPGEVKRGLIHTVMKILRKYDDVKGLMIQKKDNAKCSESNEGLLVRYRAAVGLAADLIRDFDGSLRTGKALNARFDRTFE